MTEKFKTIRLKIISSDEFRRNHSMNRERGKYVVDNEKRIHDPKKSSKSKQHTADFHQEWEIYVAEKLRRVRDNVHQALENRNHLDILPDTFRAEVQFLAKHGIIIPGFASQVE